MESSRAKIVGPVIAAGAVSLGLVLIGACGVGKQDTYIAPPPLKSAVDAAPVRDGTSATVPKVIIPPSPTWRVAPDLPRRSAFTMPSAPAPTSESSSRPTYPRATTTPVPPPWVTTTEEEPTTTRPQPEDPTTTRRPVPTTPSTFDSEEDPSTFYSEEDE